MKISTRKHAVRLCVLLIFLAPLFTHASATSGTISHSQHFAWSNNSGWVNWDAIGGNVIVTDTAMTGFLWSANNGWINLSPTHGGVINDGDGNLSGFAWDSTAGWTDFTGAHINASGLFTGQTTSNPVFGIMTFDCTHCAVATDWRPVSARTPATPPSTGSGQATPNTASTGGGIPSLIGTPMAQANPVVARQASQPPGVTVPSATAVASLGTAESAGRGGPLSRENSGPASLQASTENPALFDVTAEPVQSTQQSTILFIVFSIIAGTLLAVFLLLVVHKIRAYRVARAKIKEEMNPSTGRTGSPQASSQPSQNAMAGTAGQVAEKIQETKIPEAIHDENDNQNEIKNEITE